MRVLMATPSFYPVEGGTETMVRNLSKELNRIGVHVDVMTFNMARKWSPEWKGNVEKIDGFTVYRVPALNWLPINHSPRLTFNVNLIPGRFNHLMKDYDIIHFNEVDFSFPLFSYFVRKPKIFHLHGINFDYFKKYHISRFLLKNVADLYISLTNQMEKELIALGLPQENIECLPNSVDTKNFQPKGKKCDNTLLYVGRISPTKGLHVLLNALKHVRNSVTLEIIGPKDWNWAFHQKILKMIEDENQIGKHKIKYLGHVDKSTLLAKYQTATLFVSPSIFEPFGVVLLEAMACGTPVVSTRTQGPLEIIEDGKNGILIPINNPVKLAEAIDYVLENNALRAKLGKNARELVEHNFSMEAIGKRLYGIYEKIVTT